ncbi:hypothetical protein NF867_14235 [Solitalea sp. MAHUQ-68]|uniref:Uncharacterized protein n=1 Tax=Solitalea agri TaxID=2953739 RepID=A0A9X2F494_9SPHI|nr:hypothetical protein [Solitalea agri]MCO4294021.1 hypothetical protein [Solitalea agri]
MKTFDFNLAAEFKENMHSSIGPTNNHLFVKTVKYDFYQFLFFADA